MVPGQTADVTHTRQRFVLFTIRRSYSRPQSIDAAKRQGIGHGSSHMEQASVPGGLLNQIPGGTRHSDLGPGGFTAAQAHAVGLLDCAFESSSVLRTLAGLLVISDGHTVENQPRRLRPILVRRDTWCRTLSFHSLTGNERYNMLSYARRMARSE
jgi:hypothetical protein